ncbi:PAS domain-containing protein [Lacticaseibacillus jixianensis]|uniref:PAS domain-containing protein n=1 Tax=Lacticaseibacillus jixianensis TaxID=2486012 RepID=A0ABW4B928_9LACO|nr:PAS domain-containing protein [Lacticaseibacillus jixianensis]
MAKPEFDGAYINMATGRLSLLEVQQIFSTIPFEVDLIDHADHFSWYSNKPNREHVRRPDELGENVQDCHPAKVWPIVKGIIDSFKDGSRDSVARPLTMHGHRVYIQYYALRDEDGNYLGTIEFTGSVEPILQAYEKGGWSDAATGASKADGQTGQPDASTGASATEAPAAAPDASTGASEETAAPAVDATTGASEEEAAPAKPDASTGASESQPAGTDPQAGPFTYDL